MLARAQKIVVLIWVGAPAGWLLYFLLNDHPWVATVGAVAMASSHALVLASEFALLGWLNRDDPAPRANASMRLRAWRAEVACATRVFGWEMPFRSRSEPDHLPAEARGRRGVLLVHGFLCNRGVWNRWMHRLRQGGVPFVAINLEPVLASIENYPPLVDRGVRALEAACGLPPVVVAHSMGGLAIRAWLRRYEADERVHRLITIATPHRGSWFARFGLSRNAREMRHLSPWLEALARDEPHARRTRFTCFYSHCDNIAAPASTATLPGADNRHVPGAAHVDLLFEEQVYTEVLGHLTAAQAGGSAEAAQPEASLRSSR